MLPGGSVGAPGVAAGEACFTTAMTGYEEAVTDPSYVAQVLCFAYPLIGTYGVDERRLESERVQCEGVVMRDARPAFAGWLRERGVVALTGVDTRTLVRRIRAERRRPLRARRRAGRGVARTRARRAADRRPAARPAGRHARAVLGRGRPARRGRRPRHEVLDPAAARGRRASKRSSCRAPGTPTRSSTTKPRVVLVSNGPGDPAVLVDQIETIRSLLGRVPVFGICLGHQLLGLALGHETFKLPFGHRGANHPVRDAATGRVLVTVQNHGFAVAADDDVAFVSLNDGTCEGLVGDGFASVQFHPEAAPGPLDALPVLRPPRPRMPKRTDLRTILILGSGPIRIGQACEFDYAGAQACRVLRREGYRVVLVNSNPATIMTDPEWADATYLEPLDAGDRARGDRARTAGCDPADARRTDGAEPRRRAAPAAASS